MTPPCLARPPLTVAAFARDSFRLAGWAARCVLSVFVDFLFGIASSAYLHRLSGSQVYRRRRTGSPNGRPRLFHPSSSQASPLLAAPTQVRSRQAALDLLGGAVSSRQIAQRVFREPQFRWLCGFGRSAWFEAFEAWIPCCLQDIAALPDDTDRRWGLFSAASYRYAPTSIQPRSSKARRFSQAHSSRPMPRCRATVLLTPLRH